ncbi:MAG: homoserine kinase [Saprospiraceae bacterium]|nr:homoserine kinase [Saprospiraceae bacterium]
MVKLKTGIKVFAPATVSNLCCGFNSLAAAIDGLGDEIIVRPSNEEGIHLTKIRGDKKKLSLDTDINIAGVAAKATYNYLRQEGLISKGLGIALELNKKVSIQSGLGSSASSAVAGAMAVNEAFGRPLTKRELLPFVAQAESQNHGFSSIQSAASALLGGLVFVRNHDQMDVHRLLLPRGLCFVIFTPTVRRRHWITRKDLPSTLSRAIAQQNAVDLAGMVYGLSISNFDLVQRSLSTSWVEELLQETVPYFDELKSATSGSLGMGISGMGNSVFVLCHNTFIAERILADMNEIYTSNKLRFNSFISSVNQEGATLQ